MIYLLVFYWFFAGLFCFGVVFEKAEEEEGRSLLAVLIGCIVTGGVYFPMYLGKFLSKF